MHNLAIDVLYSHARERGQRGQLWAFLSGRSHCLLGLDEIDTNCTVDASTYAGIEMVPI